MSRPSWYTAEDARADRAARYGATHTPAPIGGVLAWFDGECACCDEQIIKPVSSIVHGRGSWILAGHANGADDEGPTR